MSSNLICAEATRPAAVTTLPVVDAVVLLAAGRARGALVRGVDEFGPWETSALVQAAGGTYATAVEVSGAAKAQAVLGMAPAAFGTAVRPRHNTQVPSARGTPV